MKRAREGDRGAWAFVLPWTVAGTGGVNTVVRSLLHECRAMRRAAPLLIEESWADARPVEIVDHGLAVVRLRLRPPCEQRFSFRVAVAFWLTLPMTLARLNTVLRRHGIEVISLHYPGPASYVFNVLRWTGLYRGRLLVSVHGSDLRDAAASRGRLRRVWSTILRSCDRVIACSRALADECRMAFPESSGNVSVIHNAVDVANIEHGANNADLPEQLTGSQYILNVAKFDSYKGQDVLVRAFAHVADVHPRLHLALVGAPGPNREELAALVRRTGLGDRIHFFERVAPERIGVFYRHAAMFVLPSRREAFGIAVLEAGVMKRAVIATDVGGLPEFLRHERNALLVAADDIVGLADAMTRLIRDPGLAERLAESLHGDVLRHFTWPRAWREYQAIADV